MSNRIDKDKLAEWLKTQYEWASKNADALKNNTEEYEFYSGHKQAYLLMQLRIEQGDFDVTD